MCVARGDAWNRMPEGRQWSTQKIPFRLRSRQRVPQHMHSHALQPGLCADALQYLRKGRQGDRHRATRGTPRATIRTGCASISFTASAPIGRSCAPLLVSSKRMQRCANVNPCTGEEQGPPCVAHPLTTADGSPPGQLHSPPRLGFAIVWPSLAISSKVRIVAAYDPGAFSRHVPGFP